MRRQIVTYQLDGGNIDRTTTTGRVYTRNRFPSSQAKGKQHHRTVVDRSHERRRQFTTENGQLRSWTDAQPIRIEGYKTVDEIRQSLTDNKK